MNVDKDKDISCYVGTEAVIEKNLPAPFLDSYYYPFFEYADPTVNNESGFCQQITSFFSDYMPSSADEGFRYLDPSYRVDPCYVLLELCRKCTKDQTAPECYDCLNREKQIVICPVRRNMRCSILCSFVHQFHGFLRLQNDYACVRAKQSSDPSSYCLQKCQYDPEISKSENEHRITVHDLRLHGHSSIVQISFEDHRCTPKKELLRNLPGIYKGSGSNQVRYSIRLAKRVHQALIEGYPRNYISEATAIPYDSIRSWLRREKEKFEREIRKQRCSFNFTRQDNYGLYLSKPTKIGEKEFIVCRQDAIFVDFLTGVYPLEEWAAMAEIFRGNLADIEDNCFLKKMNAHVEECFLYQDMIFHYLASVSYMAPAVTTHIVLRILMKYFRWEIVIYPEMPDQYKEFYEKCWELFQREFDLSSPKKPGAWLLKLICVFSPEIAESSGATYQKINRWYDSVSLLMKESGITLASLPYWNAEEDMIRFRELALHATVSPEGIPVLLQYYNPELAPHSGEADDPHYEYFFNEEGDFDFAMDFVPMPGLSFSRVIRMLEAGLLEEDRGTIEPISAWL